MSQQSTDSAQNPSPNAQALAVAAAQAMYVRDRTVQGLGIELAAVRPGYAKMNMTVREDMLNGHKICHGGFIFTLADCAFAYAGNSYNQNTVASGCAIDFLAAAHEGMVLTAEAVEQSRSGRMGVYDITITDQSGRRVALFRGKSYQIRGEVIGDLQARDDR